MCCNAKSPDNYIHDRFGWYARMPEEHIACLIRSRKEYCTV